MSSLESGSARGRYSRMAARSKAPLPVRAAIACVLAGACSAALIYAAERVQQRRAGHSWLIDGWSGTGATVYDPLLGWTSPPATHWPDYYGPGDHCTFNARGFRALEEYADAPPKGRVRVLVLGDSFAFGLGVGDDDTFPAQLERRHPRVQAVNLAKSSYGLDQAVLRYERDASGMDADIVLLAVIDDDLNRSRSDHFNGYRPKPRFRVVDGGELQLTGTPVPNFSGPITGPIMFLRRSALFLIARQYLAESFRKQDDVTLTLGILGRLRRLADERSHEVALAYLPTISELHSDELLPLAALLEQYANQNSVPFVQTASAFDGLDAEGIDECFLEVNGHYSARGNGLVAEALAAALGLDDPAW